MPKQAAVHTPTEAELVEAVRHGNIDGFGELYRRHYITAVGVAYSMVADRHLAEDAAQEAFVIACRELARLRRTHKFVPWLCTITRRVACQMARLRPSCRTVDDTVFAPTSNHEPHPCDLVRQAVSDLPQRAREVVVLHYFTGLSHKEIATSLGVSLEAVHGRLVRARRMLADRLRGNGMGEVEL